MDKREQILANALELFCSRGYDAVGVQEIAERSGVTKPTLYYYFKSKYGLLQELLHQGCGPFLEKLEQAAQVHEGQLLGDLCACARAHADFAAQQPRYFHLLFSMYHSPRESDAYRAARPYIRHQQDLIRGIFEASAGHLGNMRGRQQQFGLGFFGLIHAYIIVRSEESTDGSVQITDDEIYSLVHQFMYGIYS